MEVPVEVVVVGSANADLVVRVSRRPTAGETVLGSDLVVLPGGKGANVAVAAARVGARVALLGVVGTDPYGDLLLDSLRAAGVDTALMRRGRRPTGCAFITVTDDGENSIVVSPGANAELTIDPAALDNATVLVCSLEIPVAVAEQAVRLAVSRGVRPILNLSPVRSLAPETLAALDPLVVNEHEAAALLGAAPTAAALLALGPRSVVITLGSRGAEFADRTGRHAHLPAPPVDPVDTTGAGDAFTGALAARFAAGDDLPAAVTRAVAVAAIAVTRQGAQLPP